MKERSVSATSFSLAAVGALISAVVIVNGKKCDVLVDTACSKIIVHAGLCQQWTRKEVAMVQISGARWMCPGGTSRCSEGSLFRRFIVPTLHCSDVAMVRGFGTLQHRNKK